MSVTYSESQINGYITRFFYNVAFSTYLRSNAAGKRYIRYIGDINLPLNKMKSSLLRIIKKI